MRHTPIALVVVLLAWLPIPAPENAAATDAACRSAMAPYYAALLASARGDGDGTLRQLLLLKSRWAEVARRSGSDAPAWLRDTAAGPPVGAAVGAKIDSALRHLPRDIPAAHADLETIRALLRDARTRHGARSVDDAVTEYHEAVERLTSHIGLSNEMALTAKDFTAIGEDVDAARSIWAKVESSAELTPLPGWRDAADATTRVLGAIAEATGRRDTAAVQQASQILKNRYFDLLSALSRRA